MAPLRRVVLVELRVKKVNTDCRLFIVKYNCLSCAEAIAIPPEQPIMHIKDLNDVIIPTMDIKVTNITERESVFFSVSVMCSLEFVYVGISLRWIHQANMKTL